MEDTARTNQPEMTPNAEPSAMSPAKVAIESVLFGESSVPVEAHDARQAEYDAMANTMPTGREIEAKATEIQNERNTRAFADEVQQLLDSGAKPSKFAVETLAKKHGLSSTESFSWEDTVAKNEARKADEAVAEAAREATRAEAAEYREKVRLHNEQIKAQRDQDRAARAKQAVADGLKEKIDERKRDKNNASGEQETATRNVTEQARVEAENATEQARVEAENAARDERNNATRKLASEEINIDSMGAGELAKLLGEKVDYSNPNARKDMIKKAKDRREELLAGKLADHLEPAVVFKPKEFVAEKFVPEQKPAPEAPVKKVLTNETPQTEMNATAKEHLADLKEADRKFFKQVNTLTREQLSGILGEKPNFKENLDELRARVIKHESQKLNRPDDGAEARDHLQSGDSLAAAMRRHAAGDASFESAKVIATPGKVTRLLDKTPKTEEDAINRDADISNEFHDSFISGMDLVAELPEEKRKALFEAIARNSIGEQELTEDALREYAKSAEGRLVARHFIDRGVDLGDAVTTGLQRGEISENIDATRSRMGELSQLSKTQKLTPDEAKEMRDLADQLMSLRTEGWSLDGLGDDEIAEKKESLKATLNSLLTQSGAKRTVEKRRRAPEPTDDDGWVDIGGDTGAPAGAGDRARMPIAAATGERRPAGELREQLRRRNRLAKWAGGIAAGALLLGGALFLNRGNNDIKGSLGPRVTVLEEETPTPAPPTTEPQTGNNGEVENPVSDTTVAPEETDLLPGIETFADLGSNESYTVDVTQIFWDLAHQLAPGNEAAFMQRSLDAFNQLDDNVNAGKRYILAPGFNTKGQPTTMVVDEQTGAIIDQETLDSLNKAAVRANAG